MPSAAPFLFQIFPHTTNMSLSDDEEGTIPLTQHKLTLELRTDPIRGRGVFTRVFIPKNTLVEISPILLFSSEEYAAHGKFTILDSYTYCWQGGYALALGLGSMFNHDSCPNVGFIRDIPNSLIKYVTLRDVQQEEELCISYGNHLWFDDGSAAAAAKQEKDSSSEEELFPFQDSEEEEEDQ
jgi:SET domain-containing protein